MSDNSTICIRSEVADKIQVRTMMGQIFNLVVDSSFTISDVKYLIKELHGIPQIYQKLINMGITLLDSRTLEDYSIGSGSTLFLVDKQIYISIMTVKTKI